MRDGWLTRPLGDCCQIKPPKSEARKRLSNDELVSFVPMHDLGIREKWLKPTEEKSFRAVAGSYTYFADGDVLLAKITPCFENGKLGIAKGLTNGIGFGSSEFFVLRPDKSLDAEFLFYFLSQDSFQDAGASVMSGAVGHKRVPNEFIQKVGIPVPPLPEQKRMVAIFDEVFAGIATAVTNTEKNLANAQELFQSYLAKVSSDEKPLGNHVQIVTGKLNANAAVESGQYPFFTCSREIFQIDNYAFDCEAILLAGNNASGDFNVKHYAGKFNAYQRTYVITVNNENELKYRYLYFQMLRGLKQLKKGSVGVGTKFLKLDMIKNLPISVPSISRQYEVLSVLDALDADVSRIESIYEQKLTALAELKQSLLQKAFSGELTADKEVSNAFDNKEEVA